MSEIPKNPPCRTQPERVRLESRTLDTPPSRESLSSSATGRRLSCFYGLPSGLWCVLHRARNLFPHPGMPHGKPAFVRCVQLTPDNQCQIFGDPGRPAVCASLAPNREMCGQSTADAVEILTRLEWQTRP